MTPYRRWTRTSALLVLMFLAGCRGSGGPAKHPVKGSVRVNGQPAALVRVQFLHKDQTLPGNLKSPVGMTDEAGAFHLSTTGDKDGAVEGEYTVTFEWMSGNDLSAFDKLGGRFADEKTTKYKARVNVGANQLELFELTVPEAQILKQRPQPQR